jgi:hypothetical protein
MLRDLRRYCGESCGDGLNQPSNYVIVVMVTYCYKRDHLYKRREQQPGNGFIIKFPLRGFGAHISCVPCFAQIILIMIYIQAIVNEPYN